MKHTGAALFKHRVRGQYQPNTKGLPKYLIHGAMRVKFCANAKTSAGGGPARPPATRPGGIVVVSVSHFHVTCPCHIPGFFCVCF